MTIKFLAKSSWGLHSSVGLTLEVGGLVGSGLGGLFVGVGSTIALAITSASGVEVSSSDFIHHKLSIAI